MTALSIEWRGLEEGVAGQNRVIVHVKVPPYLLSLMITGTSLHFVHVFMFGFQWWRNHPGRKAWTCHPLGSMALEQSLLLSGLREGLVWMILNSHSVLDFFFKCVLQRLPMNPQWFLSWDLLWSWRQRGHKLAAPPRCHRVTCFLCLPGQLTSLRASQKPWWPHCFLGPELITIKKAPTCSQSLSVFGSELLSWAFYQLSSLAYRFIYPFRISTSLWTSSQ